ncbi:kinase-like domain-containing protein [Pisolithus orientalis]|uniref:kinase-like domain-containing protein n=1 Tax=Pisolithus orientalis TaxID=936130 RepID=UPI002224212E|nr:kinase-like domain-containing protein [Pisolithus orientalis]KAI6008846.1 kinase-like domain-containing protein [Pisolithus orientalis]
MIGIDSTYEGPPSRSMTLCSNDWKENDNPDFEHHLQQLSERASRFAIDLNGQVDRDTKEYFIGGDAIVYKGRLRPEGTFVAVKTFRFAHRGDSTVPKTILREVHVWSKLMHPNVLPLLGITTKLDSTISIISKWMSNGNAHDYVQDPKVDPRPLLLGIARGLDYLHNRSPCPVYHGDLKGLNVLISDEGHALLTDFGLSYLVNSSFSMADHERCGGSLNWMAPELLDTEGNAVMTPAGDVWSFGMTALELFTRKKPFHETGHHIRVLVRILNRRLPCRPSDDCTWSRMTDEWWNLCCLCWNTTPSLRPPMSQVVDMIEQTTSESVAGTLGGPAQRATSPLTKVIQQVSQFDISVFEEIEEHLDGPVLRGRYATVFRGVIPSKGINVAIKSVRSSPPAQDWAIRRVLREVDTWSKLNHENIRSLLGITFKFDFTISLVFPWMEKGNVHDFVQDTAVDPRPLLVDIANGLQYLHNHHPPIYHGDLKGSNVLISDDGRALLTDFGLPFLISLVFTMGTNATNQSSMNWTAPEGFDQPSLTAEMDVWAFGMTALELFTRQPPFHDIKQCSRVMSQIAEGRMPSRPSSDSTCFRMTDSWWKICRSCWEHDPSLRPNMLDIASQVKQIPLNDTISIDNRPATSVQIVPFSPPRPNFIFDCVRLHEFVSSGDRRLVSPHISDRMRSGLAILARAVESSIRGAEQGVLLARSILETENETELQVLTKNYQHLFKAIRGNLRDAQMGLETVLSQCKNMTWELVNHAKADGILARFGGKVKARHDAMMHLHRVTDTLVPAIDGMNLLIDWWFVLLNAAGVLAEVVHHTSDLFCFRCEIQCIPSVQNGKHTLSSFRLRGRHVHSHPVVSAAGE